MSSPAQKKNMTAEKREDSIKKMNKPLMEKRRRARINHSLTQLKHLVIDAMKNDTTQVSKLEKADILEMTVNYLRSSQYQHKEHTSSTKTYKTGFNECATEVMRYLGDENGVNCDTKSRLGDHLTRCARVMHTQANTSSGNTTKVYGNQLLIDIPKPSEIKMETSPIAVTGQFTTNVPLLHPVQHVPSIGEQLIPMHVTGSSPINKYNASSLHVFNTGTPIHVSSHAQVYPGNQVQRCLKLSPVNSAHNQNIVIQNGHQIGQIEYVRNMQAEEDRLNNNENVWRPW